MAVQNEAKDPAAAALMAIEEALNLVKQETPTLTAATQVPADPRARGAAPLAVEGPLATPRTSDVPTPEIQPFSDTGRAAPRPMLPAGVLCQR